MTDRTTTQELKLQSKELEFKLRTKELVSVLCRDRTKDHRDIERWIHDGLIIIVPNAEDISIPDSGKNWEVLTDSNNNFKKAVLLLDKIDTSTAIDILVNDILPIVRRFTNPVTESSSSHPASTRRYTLYIHPGSKRVQAIEHRYEIAGAILGPLWLAYKGGSFSLVVLSFFASIAPFFIFGVNFWTIFWALITWSIHARSHVGTQAVRLKQLGYVRLGDQTARSADEAIASASRHEKAQ